MSRVPMEPLSIEQVLERWPTLRQSLLSSYDDCPLSAYFSMRHGNGWSTSPQASGTMFHRTAAEILRAMQANNSRTIPRREALEILVEQCYQRDVEPRDIVRVPLRDMPGLRMAVDKFAKDNEFSTHKIVDVERRLAAPIRYQRRDGSYVDRMITGQLDALLFDPPNGAVVIDWKSAWGMPPEPKEAEPQGYDDEELKGLSFHGYFQQRVYGWLVMMAYRNIDRVTLREFYVRKTQVRKATLHRHQMPDVEDELRILAAAFDSALEQGAPDLRPGADGLVDMDALGWWHPQPGRHCGFCLKPTACPIEADVRIAAGSEQNGAAATSPDVASLWAARLEIADRVRTAAIRALKGYVETSGQPVPQKWSKGRREYGWYQTKRGRRFGAHTPEDSDRGLFPDVDAQLVEAMRESTARAKAERGVKPRRRGTRRRAKV